jgi:hypothetical protein
MRTLCFALVLFAACKNKEEAKPTPAAPAPTAPAPAPAATPEPALPTPEAPKPTEAAPAAIKPAGGFNTEAEYEAKAMEMIDQLTTTFSVSGTNCEKLADNIDIFIDRNKAAIASTDAFQDANPGVENRLEAKMQDKAKKFMVAANASMQACQNHEGVKAALSKLPN